jgi:hypothetical protein
MKIKSLKLFLILLSCTALAGTNPFVGSYGEGDVVLVITGGEEGRYSGTITVYDESISFTAIEQEDGSLEGSLVDEGENIPLRLTLSGSSLVFSVAGESSILTRQPRKSAETKNSGSSPETAEEPATSLRINGVAINPDQIRQFERENRIKLPGGDFWYDRISGAWGIAGGPTLGFTAHGMNLGGPLRADASGGNTGVFINGRQLPLQDVLGLQSLGVPVQLGRWWVDHQGNFGIEGNSFVMGNLFQYSSGKGGSYQRATAGGYIGGDGTTSYFFDPKTGASVMTGP